MKLIYFDEIKNEYKWKKGNITFYDTELNETQLIKIEKYILNKGKYKEVIFNKMNIIDFGSNLLLLETDEKNIEKYKKLFIKNFKQDGYFAKKLENERHSPKYKGYFELEGKHYIMVDGVNKLTQEIDKKLGIYKGVIVNPESYFGGTDLEIEKNKGTIENLLPTKANIN